MTFPTWQKEIILACLRDQFPGARIDEGDVTGSPSHLVALVAFHGEHGRGSLGLVACSSAIEGSAPDLDGAELDHEDWLGELANQALGRMKRELGDGAAFHAAPPVVLHGTDIRVAGNDSVGTYLVHDGGNVIEVWIDFTTFGLPAAPTAGRGDDALDAGDTLLF